MRILMMSCLPVLALTGCTSPLSNPTYMPAGYAYHQALYKTQPGPEAASIGYEYSAEQNAAVQESWRGAVSDLVLRARAHDMLDRPVFLTTDIKAGPFASAYDFALREELRAAGAVLAAHAYEGRELFYSAYDPAGGSSVKSSDSYNDKLSYSDSETESSPSAPSKMMKLVLATVENGAVGTRVSTMQEIPLYGFKPGEHNVFYKRTGKISRQQCCGPKTAKAPCE